MTNFKMKYFVLNPHKKDIYGEASRDALLAYAKKIETDDPAFAKEIRRWRSRIIKILFMLLLILLAGCGPSVSYNPETRQFDYRGSPFGKSIGRVEVLRETDGSIIFTMEDYRSEEVSEIVSAAVEAAIRGATR